MTNKNKLRELFITVPEIKKDLMELKFWTKISCNTEIWKLINFSKKDNWYNVLHSDNQKRDFKWEYNEFNKIEIIWNKLEKRHIEIYMSKQFYSMCRFYNEWLILRFWLDRIIVKLDNTKDFDNQTEETYWEIFNFLNDNK